MWTPKRVLLLVLGLFLFVGGYALYAHQLGMIDGLPPLPEQYHPDSDQPPVILGAKPPGAVVRKLETAFGRECPEVKRPIKIEVPARGIVLAAKDYYIERDGRVQLRPLSIALFGKTKGDDGTPEINTVRSDVAFLTFEKPIVTVADMGKHRIIAAQIAGNIRIVNNRRTLSRDDDLSVDVSKGPLFYDSKEQKVWSDDFVHVEDAQSKPRPTQISGQGFVLDLIAEQLQQSKPGQPRQRSRQMDSISGVKTALLKSSVDMHLYVDAKSGFLAGGAPKDNEPAKPTDPKKPPEKAHLIVKTQGPFRYDLTKDFATFDIPPPRADKQAAFPEHVVVTRVHDALGKLDQLICEHLELQFRKKDAAPPSAAKPGAVPAPTAAKAKKPDAPGDRSSSLQVETAHAIGKSVTLASDAEMLEAHGHDFFYDARTQTTTLKGNPMWAIKEGNEIQAKQLQIINTKDSQTARAEGPGILSLFDKTTGKRPNKARWTKMLISTRDGDYDLLHLTGKASFIDDVNKSELHADDLRVWMIPETKKPTPPADGKPVPAPAAAQPNAPKSRRPHHLIATGHVLSRSKELNIQESDRLVVWFADAPPSATPPPASPGKPAPSPTTGNKPATADAGKTARPEEKKKEDDKKPIELWAKAVEAHVLRTADKSQLQRMRCEGPNGSVHVVQAPSKPGEKGVDIKGDVLNLTAHPEGNYLVVTGDVARLEMDKMSILGPEVNIDQVSNKAWVNGIGAMTMESDTDFQGNKLKKAAPLTIHWNRSMVFAGNHAVFQGGIQADQENARLTCRELQVFFDKPISLKESQKEKERAKVRNLICDGSARVEDSVIEKGKEVKYQQLSGKEIAYDNEEGTVQAYGPGEFRLMQLGEANGAPANNGPMNAPAGPAPGPGQKKNEEMKLTYVQYYVKMQGNKKNNTAIFRTNVRVLHMPGNNPRVDVDLNKVIEKMPEGAMYLRCDTLKVATEPNQAGGKGWQEMEAKGRVSVLSPEFSGQADVVKYNEKKDQVIFEGGPGGVATLYKVRVKGERPQRIDGKKITYSRRTGQHAVEGALNIIGQ